ncbi:protein-histidine N-methyltransferase ASCRUDRAFT_30996 [Ascoidea rubescens DSM 1968]|uniref:S-adenosyl-L-methionine-dependent methyltransferase n=1 Tax=Ascoidea rubescens DSM 1968 TaxID=1344418 RepID=A0A1D2VPX2_9ASCO|nr:hypothetical protein ASCRUDRAFT_30996 [Ascoidea rubescens DSM 1968]ODV63649.1 hypothetical protein ASCRUDRAFT_30996 [Ascoidea rubescens DSM 1968]
MGFTFGFTEDDFSDDETLKNKNIESKQLDSVCPLDNFQVPSNHQPKLESLEEILRSLANLTISFTTSTTIQNNIVYRRELFDVKHQLMTEDNIGNDNDEFQILLGDTNEDLKTNIYEGGLKSWECAFDVVDKLSSFANINEYDKIVEIGCGTALPSCFLLKKIIEDKISMNDKPAQKKLDLILSDYNYSVLRLVTVPNLILSWASTLSVDILKSLQENRDQERELQANEIFLSQNLLDTFYANLKSNNITLHLVSGSWCRDYIDIINGVKTKPDVTDNKTLLISSETIYSPTMLPIISEVIIELQNCGNQNNLALVAAKDIYFGVGGSVADFINYLEGKIRDGTNIKYRIEKIDYSGLKRSMIEVNST